MRVAVATVKVAAPRPGAPPLVYVDGGPGEAGLRTVGASFARAGADSDFLQLSTDRDLVFFNPRGTGSSVPPLHCAPPTGPEGNWDAATRACWDRLRAQGIALDQYGTLASADDLDDLRRALGYRQWDLLGGSYGTRVVLEVLRRHPQGVRAAIVDSVLAPEVDLLAQTNPSIYRALDLALRRCGSDDRCNRRYPELATVLVSVLGALAARPGDGDAGQRTAAPTRRRHLHGRGAAAAGLAGEDGGDPQLIFQV